MTTATARKLTKAGISLDHLTISRNEIEIAIPAKDEDGRCNAEASRRLMNKVVKALGWKVTSGFRTGYGSWIVRPTRETNLSKLASMNID